VPAVRCLALAGAATPTMTARAIVTVMMIFARVLLDLNLGKAARRARPTTIIAYAPMSPAALHQIITRTSGNKRRPGGIWTDRSVASAIGGDA
jgi:hypothetical protein